MVLAFRLCYVILDTEIGDNDDDLLSSYQSSQDIDLKTILLEVRRDLKHMSEKIDKIEKSVYSLEKDNKKLK